MFENAFFSQRNDLASNLLVHRFACRDVHRRPECALTADSKGAFAAVRIALLIGQYASQEGQQAAFCEESHSGSGCAAEPCPGLHTSIM